jgi:hypothetical protein
MDLGQGCCLLIPGVDRELEEGARSHGVPPPLAPLIHQTELNGGEGAAPRWPERRRRAPATAQPETIGGVAASSLVRAQGAVHAGEISTVATMAAEILRHSEVIGYDVCVVPAMLLEAWVAELRDDPGAAEDAYRRALELAGRIGFVDHPSPWSDSARTRSRAGTRARPRSSVGGRWPWPRRPRRRASPRMRACSSPASWRRPTTRTPPRRCMPVVRRGQRLPWLGAAPWPEGPHADGAPSPCGVARPSNPAHAGRAVAVPAPATAAAWQPRPSAWLGSDALPIGRR